MNFVYICLLPFSGKDVHKAGVATHYIESANLPDLEKALLDTKNANEVDTVLKKHCLEDKTEFVLAKNMDQINKCFSADTVEGIVENLEKDGSDWAKNALKVN
jgi:3-hydroxyisobutyryl-CoA hydrolase